MAEIATGEQWWSIQRKIGRGLSAVRAKLAVPSCNASGKTWLAARLGLAFYEAFVPGTPCVLCGGPCGGAKVISLSSKEQHLRDNLWGEVRAAYAKMDRRGMAPVGTLYPGDLRLESITGKHYFIGQTATAEEGIQGAHAAHKLIIGDEATAVSEGVSKGITSLMASGDTRLLLIFNPTTPDTYAAQMSRSEKVETIRITAFDTPHFTGEPVPEGSNLITPAFLEELQAQGMGPGSYEWTTRVLAEFWDVADDVLIKGDWFDAALTRPPDLGVIQIGVDIASYGTSENVIAVRRGNELVSLKTFPAMRVDVFFAGPVASAVREWAPQYLVYDADGVGAGAIGEAEKVGRIMPPGGQVIGFRGAVRTHHAYANNRSAWYWNLRRRLEAGRMSIRVRDPHLREQLTNIRYSIQNGAIKVETKAEMKKRNVASPDRADGVMYAFALSDELLAPSEEMPTPTLDYFGVKDRSDEAMWERDLNRHTGWQDIDPVLGVAEI
jgi:hypothetical protein